MKTQLHKTRHLVSLILAVIGSMFLFAATAQANTYVVTSKADTDGQVCGASCTLRQAINAANSHAGFDVIDFNISGDSVRTITPLTFLPAINDGVYIDGYTQKPCSGNPAPCAKQNTLAVGNNAVLLIELNGAAIPDTRDGLTINAAGCTVRGLIINRFTRNGIVIASSASNTVLAGNWIGLDQTGSHHQSNLIDGVYINNSSNNTIGGTTPAARNVISGNDIGGGVGVHIRGSAASGNKIQGNYIGTDMSGSYGVANNTGVSVEDQGHGTTIGGTVPGSGNLISGNDNSGAHLYNAYNNLVQGNIIGLDASGTSPVGNGYEGIYLVAGSITNTIGGTTASARNVISGNGDTGVFIFSASSNVVEGNYIGTNAAGDSARANGGNGIWVAGNCQSNKIGDVVAGAGNVISGNKGDAVSLDGNVSGTLVFHNLIGTTANGTSSLPNQHSGVSVANGAHNNSIGSITAGAGNVITANGNPNGRGVFVGQNAGMGNAIRGNSIYQNVLLGISFGNGPDPMPNDPDDADTGGNNLQNFPVLASAISSANLTTITGTLNSTADTDFRIEFFANDACDPSGYGEGKIYLGAVNATTSGHNATFSASFPGSNLGQFVTATATDQGGNTSEFSACKQVTAPAQPGSIAFAGAGYSLSESGGTANITVTRSGGSNGAVSVQYATSGGTATAGSDYTATSGTLQFADGVTSQAFNIPITNDSVYESNETVNLTLSNPGGGATLGNQSTAVLTIVDNDLLPTIAINDVSLGEGNSGTTPANFTVSLSNASYQQITVNFATTAGGTATVGNDYQPASGTLAFAPGDTSKQLSVLVNGDTVDEPNETFLVNLTSPSNSTLSKAQGTGTIVNDDAVAAPTLQFSAPEYSVTEELTAVTVTVTRSGDTSGTATVDYATSDGTAKQKGDYEIRSGTLTFNPGDVTRTFSVLINEDSYVDGLESINLTLGNASGATLGSQSTAVVNIIDDAVESVTNPNDDAQLFVHQLYHDFLNREPDAGGLAYWTGQITQCGSDQTCINAKRRAVSAAFYIELEFQETGYFVYRVQKASFGSRPSYQQFMADRSRVKGGAQLEQSKQSFADAWVQRAGFKADYPDSLTADQFVNKLYDSAGLMGYTAERLQATQDLITNAKTRAQVLRDVIETPQFKTSEYNPAFVLMQYFGYLRRGPDQAGYQFWLNVLNSQLPQDQTGYHAMVCAFITSAEYQDRFSAIHLHNNAECGS